MIDLGLTGYSSVSVWPFMRRSLKYSINWYLYAVVYRRTGSVRQFILCTVPVYAVLLHALYWYCIEGKNREAHLQKGDHTSKFITPPQLLLVFQNRLERGASCVVMHDDATTRLPNRTLFGMCSLCKKCTAVYGKPLVQSGLNLSLRTTATLLILIGDDRRSMPDRQLRSFSTMYSSFRRRANPPLFVNKSRGHAGDKRTLGLIVIIISDHGSSATYHKKEVFLFSYASRESISEELDCGR